MAVIEALARELARLPGIGPKTALRMVHSLLKGTAEDTRRLGRLMGELAERVRPCTRCGSFTEAELCSVCSDPGRDGRLLCVVEEAYEVGAIERTARFRGRYHVLGGRLSPLDGVGPEALAIPALLERLAEPSTPVEEVILAMNSGVESGATAVYLEGLIRPLGPRVTRLARGIPVGSDLEYVDGTTLAEALVGRREM